MTIDQIMGGVIAALAGALLVAEHLNERTRRAAAAQRRRIAKYGTHASGCVYCGEDHPCWAPCPRG